MNLWIVLLIGILIGWLIEWVIDWLYWRKKAQDQPVVEAKTGQDQAGQDQIATLLAAQEKIAKLEAELEECGEVRIDPLEKIKGIGPVIKTKLYSGGITSFKQLSKLTPADLEAIVGEDIKRLADEEVIISQAKKFAEEN